MLATLRSMWPDLPAEAPAPAATTNLSANVAVTSRAAGQATITATFHNCGQLQDPAQISLANATPIKDSVGQYHAIVPDGTTTVWNYQQGNLQVEP